MPPQRRAYRLTVTRTRLELPPPPSRRLPIAPRSGPPAASPAVVHVQGVTMAETSLERRVWCMRSIRRIGPLAFLVLGGVVMVWFMSGAQAAQVQPEAPAARDDGRVTQLMSENLPDFPGKEGLIVTVDYPPGGSTPIHRHNAEVFVYMLEGSIVVQLQGGEETTLTPGQTFHEGPNDVHVVSRNASATEPAKFAVFFVKDIGAPVLLPAN
jgi:quercetin dioxygenase-like cupin family protein